MPGLLAYLGEGLRNAGRRLPELQAGVEQRRRSREAGLMDKAYLDIANAQETRRQAEFEQEQQDREAAKVEQSNLMTLGRLFQTGPYADLFRMPEAEKAPQQKPPKSVEELLAAGVASGDMSVDDYIAYRRKLAQATAKPGNASDKVQGLTPDQIKTQATSAARTLQRQRVDQTKSDLNAALWPYTDEPPEKMTESGRRDAAATLATPTVKNHWFSEDETVPPADTMPQHYVTRLDQFRSPEYLAAAQSPDSVEIVDPMLAAAMREAQGQGGGGVQTGPVTWAPAAASSVPIAPVQQLPVEQGTSVFTARGKAERELKKQFGKQWTKASDAVRQAAIARWLKDNGYSR